MPPYLRLGSIPRKRHIAHPQRAGLQGRRDLLRRSGHGRPGSRGPTASSTTCGRRRACVRLEPAGTMPLDFGDEPALRHHHLKTRSMPRSGDPISGPRAAPRQRRRHPVPAAGPDEPQEELFRNADADEVVFVHRGRGTLHTMFGPLPFRDFDYIVIPRCTTYRLEFEPGCQPDLLVIEAAGNMSIPARYLNPDGQFRLGAPYSERDLHGPREIGVDRPRGGDDRADQGRPPADPLHAGAAIRSTWSAGTGWSIPTRSTPTISSRSPGRSTSRRRCSRRSTRRGSWSARSPRGCSTPHPEAIKVPYAHSNVQADEVLYYVRGRFGSRRGVEEASFTLHPRGIPHGPHPGTIVASRDVTRDRRAGRDGRYVPAAPADPPGHRAGRPDLSPELDRLNDHRCIDGGRRHGLPGTGRRGDAPADRLGDDDRRRGPGESGAVQLLQRVRRQSAGRRFLADAPARRLEEGHAAQPGGGRPSSS